MKNPFKNLLLSLISLAILSACSSIKDENKSKSPQAGRWLMKMQLEGAVLPFEFALIKSDTIYSMKIFNADEVIFVDQIRLSNDSMIIQMPVFESSFYLQIDNSEKMKGEWVNYYKGDDYRIEVVATRSNKGRFSHKGKVNVNADNTLQAKYEVHFSPENKDSTSAIGLFEVENGQVEGTFATETGDYRYLEGAIVDDSLFLSTFDGSHAFYFAASINDDRLNGIFLSGIHHREKWVASPNQNFQLKDPDSLTFMIDKSPIQFRLEDVDGNYVRLKDSLFQGKVKMIQIMGSWCPNCLDESRYFKQVYSKYHDEGLEIIAIAFERTKSKQQAVKNINQLKSREGLNYTLLLGGYSRDQHPERIFPMLNHIMSYPTTLFLDKENKLRKIHTGFYGPGTGDYYADYKKRTEAFIEKLLSE